MKANELMIGDWLRVSDVPNNIESKIGKCGKVAKLEQYPNYSGIAIQFDNEFDTYFCDNEEELEPIELTTEILKKNGFVEILKHVWCMKGFSISLKLVDGVFGYFEQGHPYSPTFVIKYVHELQHLLRIVGVEKEIEL